MKLLNFIYEGETKIGVHTAQGILDVQSAGNQLIIEVPENMDQLIQADNLSELTEIVEEARI